MVAPMKLLRQLLGLDHDHEYVTISVPLTAVILVIAFAAYLAVTRLWDAPDAIGVLIIAVVVVGAGLWLAARATSRE